MTDTKHTYALLVGCTALIGYDFLAHLSNATGVVQSIGPPFQYGTQTYEVFWSIHWGAILLCFLYILVVEMPINGGDTDNE
jgi:hypothetical protein